MRHALCDRRAPVTATTERTNRRASMAASAQALRAHKAQSYRDKRRTEPSASTQKPNSSPIFECGHTFFENCQHCGGGRLFSMPTSLGRSMTEKLAILTAVRNECEETSVQGVLLVNPIVKLHASLVSVPMKRNRLQINNKFHIHINPTEIFNKFILKYKS